MTEQEWKERFIAKVEPVVGLLSAQVEADEVWAALPEEDPNAAGERVAGLWRRMLSRPPEPALGSRGEEW